MRAIVIEGDAAEPRLVWGEWPAPACGPGEVLVDVFATAVNRADLAQARGRYPPPPGASPILGLEMAGVVSAVGAQVTTWQPGDRVWALLPGGGYAEQAAVPADLLVRAPDDWSLAQAAAVPEVWLTAYVNLFLEAQLQPGERVLVHAGASGVGTAAVQLARAAGATVYATAGSPEKTAVCRALGAELAVNYKTDDFREALLAVSDGVDLILDPVGAAYLERNLAVLRRRGRLVFIGLLGGSVAPLAIAQVMGKQLRLIGSTLRNRPTAEKAAITRGFVERFWPELVAGRLRPIIDTHFPIAEAQAAHARVAANRNIGKVILIVRPEPGREVGE